MQNKGEHNFIILKSKTLSFFVTFILYERFKFVIKHRERISILECAGNTVRDSSDLDKRTWVIDYSIISIFSSNSVDNALFFY